MVNKSDFWKRPDETVEQDKEVFFWKTLIWDNLPDAPVSEKYNDLYADFVKKLGGYLNTITRKEQIFDIKSLLISNGVIGYYRWNIFGTTTIGNALGFDKAGGLLKIPGTAEGIHSDMIFTGFGISAEEKKLMDFEFVSADDPRLKIYTGNDDDGKSVRFFEYDDEMNYAIYRDTLGIYDASANTLVFYKNQLIQASAKSPEAAKNELLEYIRSKENYMSAANYEDMEYAMNYADMINGTLDTDGSLEKKYLFTEVTGENTYETKTEKERAKQIAYISYAQLADILGVSNYAMSIQANTGVDISGEGIQNIAEKWFTGFLKQLPAEKMKELTQPLLVAIKNNEFNEDSEYFKSAVNLDQKLISEKDSVYSNDLSLMARSFSAYIYDAALEKGINNIYLTGIHNGACDEEKLLYPVSGDRTRINKAMKKLIESAKKHEYLMVRKEEPLVELTASSGARKNTDALFNVNDDEYNYKLR